MIQKINYKKIGERIKTLRKHWKFTQKQVAQYLQISQGQMAKIENGTRKPNQNMIEKLVLLYNTNYQWIIYGKGNSNIKETLHLCGDI